MRCPLLAIERAFMRSMGALSDFVHSAKLLFFSLNQHRDRLNWADDRHPEARHLCRVGLRAGRCVDAGGQGACLALQPYSFALRGIRRSGADAGAGRCGYCARGDCSARPCGRVAVLADGRDGGVTDGRRPGRCGRAHAVAQTARAADGGRVFPLGRAGCARGHAMAVGQPCPRGLFHGRGDQRLQPD